MRIDSLRLYNFRNLVDQVISFAPGANFFYGQNGQGKTSLVEAVALLAHGRSFRTSHLYELIKWEQKESSVFAHVVGEQSTFELGLSITEDSRVAYVNGNRVELLVAIMGKLLAVSFSPSDMSLVRGSPQERRRFIDKHMVDFRPTILRSVLDYHKALKHKNKLLRDGLTDRNALDSWNTILAEKALEIFGARQEFIKQLEDRASYFYQEFSQVDGELGLSLKTNIGYEDHQELTAKCIFERMRSAYERELKSASTVIGPHRDEILITLAGKPVRAFASQGQARSVVLALKLAVVELLEEARNESPIVMLDDVESELDQQRRNLLINLVFKKQRQVFMTGTVAPVDVLGSGAQPNKCWRISSGTMVLESQ